jgi:3-hydroxyacyl-CoA dehydrogenase/enoyl-CoA hydratase/3-hydroxybutyryl-CoA epimerase
MRFFGDHPSQQRPRSGEFFVSDPGAWSLQRDDAQIAWLALDKPGTSANTLGRAVLEELSGVISGLEQAPPRGLVIYSAKPSGFIAGADIKEFLGFKSESEAFEMVRAGQRIYSRIEALRCPTVAVLHGFALGGGLELALACRYRIAIDDERLNLGLPEVQLGIQPGFGGTIRSVRLLGVRKAMELMLTGKSVRADQALTLGLVDRYTTDAAWRDVARQLIQSPPLPRQPPLLERALSWPLLRLALKPALLRQVSARARRDHYPAPYAMIEQWARHGVASDASFEAEAHSIAHLFMTESAQGLIRVFLLQDRLKTLGGKAAQPARHVHVVGAGVMGGDIAAWCALRGLDVTLQDREMKFIEPALQRAAKLYERRIRDAGARAAAQARLRADVAGDGRASADVLIEAIFENLQAKQELFSAAEKQLPAHAVLATNTSSLTLESIGGALADAGRLVGLHFFNPVAQMPLVEVVHSGQTRAEPLATAMAFARRIDKLPLPCRSGPGFLVNRVLFPYLHEAMHAAGDGIAIETIDQAAVDFGMPMGPIELADVVGLDVVLHVGEIITRELSRAEPPLVAKIREMVAQKNLGRKTGRGFYQWVEGKARKEPLAAQPPAELADRLMLPMLNECVACLRDGVVADADLVDAGVVFGTGFAPFRGGPLNYARTRGVDQVIASLEQLAVRHGSRFTPDQGWTLLRSP